MSVASLRSLVTSANDPLQVDAAALPLLQGLTGLLPEGRLRRGSTVAVEGTTSLALALLAGPSQAGSWCAVVGAPELGLLAAAEYGIALDRLALVPRPGPAWASVVAALVDAFDVVAIRPTGAVPPGLASRLTARLRKHGGVLLCLGPWEGADLRLTTVGERWDELGDGHGRLRARRLRVRVSGRRGAATVPREERLWLPAADGSVAVVTEPPTRLRREADPPAHFRSREADPALLLREAEPPTHFPPREADPPAHFRSREADPTHVRRLEAV